jgi:HD-GYP domain-containing protein (c-di-GMP phosphodiesterase class II)
MTSDRPYRRALSVESALKELREGAGTQFDVEVVNCLEHLLRSGQMRLISGPSSEELQLLRRHLHEAEG